MLNKFDNGLVVKELLGKRGLHTEQKGKGIDESGFANRPFCWGKALMRLSLFQLKPCSTQGLSSLSLRSCLPSPNCLLPLRPVLLNATFPGPETSLTPM